MTGPGGLFDDFAVATALLTRLPVGAPPPAPGRLAEAAWAFPAVGVGVGAIAALVFVIAQLLGCGDWPSSLLSVLAGLGLTGALHEDGLADTADGFGGGHDRDTKLAIMRDSRHGSFGVLALVASVSLRAAALATIGEAVHAALALVAAHAVSRALLPVAMRVLPRARSDGMGAAAGRPGRGVAAVAAALGAGAALATLGPERGAAALLLAAAAVSATAALARRQIGGYTGDVLGAFQQIGEIVILLAAAAK
ncbi:MAG: adenosylcobinamide-GDP ribazoletransferase [Alphaproteobacteria bacterium]|nr:adenosylcobinamide-GDP ribazoletransferase [Alphaproteobacteria bacterium]